MKSRRSVTPIGTKRQGKSRNNALLADFDAGFVAFGKKPISVVTASDVLGSRAHHPQAMAKAWTAAFDHPDVPERGTVVVHLQRGLALLDRLQTLEMENGVSRELIRLEFAGDDAALVPPAELAMIWPYAAESGKVTLDKADGSTWWNRRGEAEQEIEVAAKALSRHIAQRKRRRAPKLIAPGPAYERFVARFPYFATVDQAKAIRDVLEDRRPVTRWTEWFAVTLASARLRSRCGRRRLSHFRENRSLLRFRRPSWRGSTLRHFASGSARSELNSELVAGFVVT